MNKSKSVIFVVFLSSIVISYVNAGTLLNIALSGKYRPVVVARGEGLDYKNNENEKNNSGYCVGPKKWHYVRFLSPGGNKTITVDLIQHYDDKVWVEITKYKVKTGCRSSRGQLLVNTKFSDRKQFLPFISDGDKALEVYLPVERVFGRDSIEIVDGF